MPLVCLTLDDLEHAIDHVHALFDGLEHDSVLPLDTFAMEVLKLALHEWVANLVQHARFGDTPARIRLTVTPEGERVRCIVEDSSEGFDLAAQLRRQQSALDMPGEVPERGRGLLMLEACAEGLLYAPCRPGECTEGFRQRLQFLVAPSDTTEHGVALFPDVTDFLGEDSLDEAFFDESFEQEATPASPSNDQNGASDARPPDSASHHPASLNARTPAVLPAASTPASPDEA